MQSIKYYRVPTVCSFCKRIGHASVIANGEGRPLILLILLSRALVLRSPFKMYLLIVNEWRVVSKSKTTTTALNDGQTVVPNHCDSDTARNEPNRGEGTSVMEKFSNPCRELGHAEPLALGSQGPEDGNDGGSSEELPGSDECIGSVVKQGGDHAETNEALSAGVRGPGPTAQITFTVVPPSPTAAELFEELQVTATMSIDHYEQIKETALLEVSIINTSSRALTENIVMEGAANIKQRGSKVAATRVCTRSQAKLPRGGLGYVSS